MPLVTTTPYKVISQAAANNYVFGGFNLPSGVRRDWIQNWDGTSIFTESNALPSVYRYGDAAVLNATSKDYIFGGRNGSVRDTIWNWDGTSSAAEIATLTSVTYFLAASELSATSADYIFGADRSTGSPRLANEINKWNGTSRTLEGSTLVEPKRKMGSTQLTAVNAIFIFQGTEFTQDTADSVNTTQKWDGSSRTTVASHPKRGFDTKACELKNQSKCYTFAGRDVVDIAGSHDNIYSYDGSSYSLSLATYTQNSNYRVAAEIEALSTAYTYGGLEPAGVDVADIYSWDGTTLTDTGSNLSTPSFGHSAAEL